MLTRLALAAALGSFAVPALTSAQGAPVCDGSEVARLERWRTVGGALSLGTGLADIVALATIPHSPEGVGRASSHFRFVAVTAPVAIAGWVIASTAHPDEGFWRRTVARMKVGETTSADVRLCLHRPAVETTTGTEARWTYVDARPAALGSGGVVHTLHLTFRADTLAAVSRTAVRRDALAGGWPMASASRDAAHPRGYCTPPVPVVADPFPTTGDTGAATAAMARARADADAAARNAANAAAYAACMASDSVR